MPLDFEGPLAQEMLKRVTSKPLTNTPVEEQTNSIPTFSPTAVSILGPLVDAASTYNFMKRGTGHEENPMFAKLQDRPSLASLSIAGSGLAVPLLKRFLHGKVSESILNTITSNIGANSLAVGAANFEGGSSGYDKAFGLLSNLNRINNSEEPKLLSKQPQNFEVARNRALYGDHRGEK